jgi:hypothetical protein
MLRFGKITIIKRSWPTLLAHIRFYYTRMDTHDPDPGVFYAHNLEEAHRRGFACGIGVT